ncbi:leucine carboxyl methyltransferase 1 [Suhomyces tanzawaensis NRRL Y-17324]|uniref:Leucine carboxyl methyltransferase 1 n=1 Tax=Suhomyces tanzawaensis NRRL Y-17324 TaxID=984487 RepID=A0A1E4SLC0_9ASCO|nr:leucine carboxyl methyltransferase 1 [Suhomyces tanzawaensis NRRL Y-17324]ODV80237.1 leucine carboxyl methyltransferase 1 [Suhomyces tanzawaensis NRRL Y-17324]
MLSPLEKIDKAIRATDLDALACRHSANQANYITPQDPFIEPLILSYKSNLQYCSGYTNLSAGRTLRSVFGERKLPLINRGTYLRTKLIDQVTEEFIKQFDVCQILSLGGGSDTRGFRFLEKFERVIYHEIDFPESTKIKKVAILRNEKLKSIVESQGESVDITSKEQFQQLSPNLHTKRYHLQSYDLRKLSSGLTSEDVIPLLKHFDSSLPTLVLSECVLCYASPSENEEIIKFWKHQCRGLVSFLIYEPMSLNDSFGATMTKNLLQRGINLQTFNELPDLNSRLVFLSDICGLSHIKLTNMSDVGGYVIYSSSKKPWIEVSDMKRINKLEFIDEVEEIKLLFEHYCLCYAESSPGDITFEGVNEVRWESDDWS